MLYLEGDAPFRVQDTSDVNASPHVTAGHAQNMMLQDGLCCLRLGELSSNVEGGAAAV